MGNPNAGSRSTDIATLLENFLDNNADDLSPNMFNELDSLAEEIDEKAEELEEQISDLQSDVEELTNRMNESEEDQ